MNRRGNTRSVTGRALLIALAVLTSPGFLTAAGKTGAKGQAAGAQKPNILFIMADDIGLMQVGIYHRGWALGEPPNIDRIGKEGAIFTQYYAMQSCTSGRNAFFTGMYPLRTGMIPPQLPGSPTYLLPGTPSLAVFLRDLGYTCVLRRGCWRRSLHDIQFEPVLF